MEIRMDRERLVIQWLDPKTMKPNEANHRKHPERQRRLLESALQEEGWIDPVIYNRQTGNILDGHLRVEMAITNDEPEVPVIVLDVEAEQERKILLRHDRIGALAEIDLDILRSSLEPFDAAGKDALGWSPDDLKELMADQTNHIEFDAAPPGDFQNVDESIETQYCCPKCGYCWSGKPKPS